MTGQNNEIQWLIHDCERSVRYHKERCAFYRWFNQAMMFAALVSSSAAITMTMTDMFDGHVIGTVFGAIPIIVPAAIGIIGFSWGAASKACDHKILWHRFSQVFGSIGQGNVGQKQVTHAQENIQEIYDDEPPEVYHALNAACYNDAAKALGYDSKHYEHIPCWKYLLRHWVRFSPASFKKRTNNLPG